MLKFLYHTCVSRGWNFKPLTGSQKPSTLGLSGGERNSVIDSVVLTQYEIDDRGRQQMDKHFLTHFLAYVMKSCCSAIVLFANDVIK